MRLRQLLNVSKREEFYNAIKVAERTERIVKDKRGFKSLKIKKELLKEREEQELYDIYLSTKDKIVAKIDNREYDKATILYGRSFYAIIDRFFQEVLVNTEDEDLKGNRKLLLFSINRLLTERVLNPKEMEVLKDAKSA